MSKPKKTFERILQGLEKYYGRPKAPAVTGPMEMILYENVAYLVDDEKRDAAFAALKKRVERKSYAASYRSAQEALAGELPQDCDTLIRAHQLLRQHGKELCRRSRPMCPECLVQRNCRYFLTSQPRLEA